MEQHGIKLPARGSDFEPNFPNYRLGPIDGSPCDTLGIDNLPIAHFRWNAVDTLSPQEIEFTDLSYYEPATWHWNFGDGSTSQDTSPVHLYSAPGTYTVCLMVCNANACDTTCQEVVIEAVSTITLSGAGGQVLLWPNPVKELLHLQSPAPLQSLIFFDATGKEVLRQAVSKEQEVVDLRQLPSGLYFVAIRAGGKLWSGKILKE